MMTLRLLLQSFFLSFSYQFNIAMDAIPALRGYRLFQPPNPNKDAIIENIVT